MQHTPHARRFFYVLLTVVVVLAVLFLRPYLMVVLFAGLLAFLFHPLYAWLRRVTKLRDWLVVPISMLGVFLTFVIPLVAVGTLVAQVVGDFARSAALSTFTNDFSVAVLIPRANDLLAKIPGIHYQLSVEAANAKLLDLAASIQTSIWHGVQGLGGTLTFLIPALFITIYVMSAVFTHYHEINVYLHQLSPLNDDIDSLYAKRITSMTVSMVRGTLVIALLQGVLTGFFLWIVGVPYAVFLGLLATFISIIPLGSGVIAIPAGIILIATGNIWQGALQIAAHYLIVANADNILRPRLVSKEASLPPALTLLGVFAGIAQFGFLGVIYGPVFMVLLVTTIEVYREHFAPH